MRPVAAGGDFGRDSHPRIGTAAIGLNNGGTMSHDYGESRWNEIASHIKRESRPTRLDVPKICPVCEIDACFGEQCVRCWKRERDNLNIGTIED